MDVFCERCGTRQPIETAPETRKNAKKTMGRLLAAAGLTNPAVSRSVFEDQFLRLCLSCRGYSCPQCWNEEVGLCQTCVPFVEPITPLPVAQAPVEARQEPEWPTLEHEIPGEPSAELPLAAASAASFVDSPAAPPPFEPSIAFEQPITRAT